jgi:hypothetical protein
MKFFDETMIDFEYPEEAFLGSRLKVEFSANDKFNQDANKITRKEFDKRLEAITEWIVIDPKDKDYSRIIKGNELSLDETFFEKQIMVHTMLRAEGFAYRGMPFQKQYKTIDLDFKRLAESMEMIYNGRMVPNENEVDRIYKYIAQSLIEFSADLNKRFKFLVKPEHCDFLYDVYKKEKVSENDSKRLRTLEEEKIFWQTSAETYKGSLESLMQSNTEIERELYHLREENKILLEEKNFFINSKYFKNTSDLSFLDEKSHELNQTNFMTFMPKELTNPIPMANALQNNTFDFGLIDEDLLATELKREFQQLKDKISDYDKMLKNYRTEIARYQNIYSQNKIDLIINENKQLRLKENSLEKQLDEYKQKIQTLDFTVKYMDSEYAKLKNFSSFFGLSSSGSEEKFQTANNLAQTLAKELCEKNKRINDLEETLERLLNEKQLNQTF